MTGEIYAEYEEQDNGKFKLTQKSRKRRSIKRGLLSALTRRYVASGMEYDAAKRKAERVLDKVKREAKEREK